MEMIPPGEIGDVDERVSLQENAPEGCEGQSQAQRAGRWYVQGAFLSGTPPKSSKYKKVNLG